MKLGLSHTRFSSESKLHNKFNDLIPISAWNCSE